MMFGPSGRISSSNQHSFSRTPRAEIPRSSFNRTSGLKTAFDAGYLVPIYVDEALPGDTVNLSLTTFARLATPIAPLMDNIYLDVFFFAVPYRLVWTNWERFNGAQDDPGDSTSFLIPQMVSTAVTGYGVGSIHDYFGIPIEIPGLSHSSLWHRAYTLVYNQWFRDQNLQNSVVISLDDGPDDPSEYPMQRSAKRHDYFTSCLPWPQKATAVSIPAAATAPIAGMGKQTRVYGGAGINVYETGDTATTNYPFAANMGGAIADETFWAKGSAAANGILQIYADTSGLMGTINQLREAVQIQKLYERDARGGTRYIEIIKSHFGVTSDDARLQRPEYLGGGTTYCNVSPIAQTSSTDGTTPQGNLAAYGHASHSGVGFVKSFTEHCLLLGIIRARADLNYQQGLPRMFSRSTRFDFYWPAFSHLGEQSVLNKEIYAVGSANPTQDAAVFGYQERYAEYRYKPNLVTGIMRSAATGTLDYWHLAQDFTVLPTLGSTFILEDPPIDRVIAVPAEPHFIMDCHFNAIWARPMPTYSIPGMMDRF